MALAPPWLRGRLLARLGSVGLWVEGLSPADRMVTNFGLGSGIRVSLPTKAGDEYLFGRPARTFGELTSLRLCASLLESCDEFVDIGSHLGLYVWYLADRLRSGVKGYFVEPQDELFEIISENLAANRLAGVLGFREAVAAQSGTVSLFSDHDNWSMSSTAAGFAPQHRHSESTVAATTFAQLAERVGLQNALVKVDIETAEWDVVSTIPTEPCPVRFLVLEVLPPGHRDRLVQRTMERLGFAAYLIGDQALEPFSEGVDYAGRSEQNWLFSAQPFQEIARAAERAGLAIEATGVEEPASKPAR